MASYQHIPKYGYQPLEASSGSSFRLLRLKAGEKRDIVCELIHSNIDHGGIEYEAVSYTWGTELNVDAILINGGKVEISLNLSCILRDLRHPLEDRMLWIDALCINQQDVPERSAQVQRMGDIFRGAWQVLFCVGRPSEITEVLFSCLHSLDAISHEDTSENENLDRKWFLLQPTFKLTHFCLEHRLRKAYAIIFAQPWFSRVWIVQEVVNAKRALILCGSRYASPAAFATVLRALEIDHSLHCSKIMSAMPAQRRIISRGVLTMYDLLCDMKDTEATDPRDKVFALLDLCSDQEARSALRADYNKSEVAIIHDLIVYFCNCTATSLQTLPWENLQCFISNLQTLHTTLLEHLLLAQDEVNATFLLQHHGRKIDASARLIHLAEQLTTSQVMELLFQLHNMDSLITELSSQEIPMLFAAQVGSTNLIDRLLDLGVSIELQQTRNSSFCYHFWTGNNFTQDALLIIPSKSLMKYDTEEYPTGGPTGMISVLCYAAALGNESFIKHLIENTALSRGENSRSWGSILHAVNLAAACNHTAVVELLLNQAGDLDASVSASFLQTAIRCGSETVVGMLLDRNAPLIYPDYHSVRLLDWTAAHDAACYDEVGALQMIFKRWTQDGMAAQTIQEIEATVLLMAALHDSAEVFRMLLERGVPATAEVAMFSIIVFDRQPSPPPYKVLNLMLTMKYAGLFSESTWGPFSALSVSAHRARDKDVLQQLLTGGVNARSEDGSFALFIANRAFEMNNASLLLEHGAVRPSQELMRTFRERVLDFARVEEVARAPSNTIRGHLHELRSQEYGDIESFGELRGHGMWRDIEM